jgi:hypothetical protein
MAITKDMMLLLPMPGGALQEIIIQQEYVERVILRSAEHEAGHVVAAHYCGARVLGITVGFDPVRGAQAQTGGMFVQALYQHAPWPIETVCMIKAAGPAADVLHHGEYDEVGASMDLRDIEAVSGVASLEPHLSKAKELLADHASELLRIRTALEASLATDKEWMLGILPNGNRGALLLDEAALLRCLIHEPTEV